MISRWPLYASVAVLGGECIACFLAGSIALQDSGHMAGIDASEAGEQNRFAIELYGIGLLNLLATIAFVFLRRSGWGWWLVLAMQAAIFVMALTEGLVKDADDIGWIWFSGFPLLTWFLLFALRTATPREMRQLSAIRHP